MTDDNKWLTADLRKTTRRVDRIGAERHALEEEKGIAYLEEHHFTNPEPIRCKWCGSTDIMKVGTRKEIQVYICQKCKRKFVDKDAPFKKQSPADQIGASLSMFYDGLSLSDIARRLKETYNNPVNPTTVYRWLLDYTVKAANRTDELQPRVSDTWVVDETVIKIGGHNMWFWDIIDEATRFLLASYISRTRGMNEVMTIMLRAKDKARKIPRFILSDSLGVYPDGIERIFGANAKHVQAKGLTHEINTNVIERFHGTIKERTKVIRGFKSLETAELIMDGFLVNYNFFRPHMTLNGKTPAEVAGIKDAPKNWTELVRLEGGIYR